MNGLRRRRAPREAARQDCWRRATGAPPWVLGHRGSRLRAPENTLAAFDLALDEGAAGIELDVRLDGSREVVVLHDRTLTRVSSTGDPRDVEALGTEALLAVPLAGGQRVPRLATVLAWARRRGARLNIELKADVSEPELLVRRVAALLRREPAGSPRCLLSSFAPGIVWRLARALPGLPTALLSRGDDASPARAASWRRLGAQGLHPEASLVDAPLVTRVHRWGGLVNVWTVNDVERARDLAALGVDGLITDDPRGLLAALG